VLEDHLVEGLNHCSSLLLYESCSRARNQSIWRSHYLAESVGSHSVVQGLVGSRFLFLSELPPCLPSLRVGKPDDICDSQRWRDDRAPSRPRHTCKPNRRHYRIVKPSITLTKPPQQPSASGASRNISAGVQRAPLARRSTTRSAWISWWGRRIILSW